MDNEDRIALIRRGNELFNTGDLKNALKIFLATDYKDGIIRVADHLYYEDKQTVPAIKLYKKAGLTRKVEEFAEKAAFTIQLFLQEDKEQAKSPKPETETTPIETWQPVHIKSEEIMGHLIEGKSADETIQSRTRKEKKS